MANLVSWNPLAKKREDEQNKSSNPFEQFGNWLSRGGFVGDIARGLQNGAQNVQKAVTSNFNQSQPRTTTQRNTSFQTSTPKFNRSTSALGTLNSLNNSPFQKQKSNFNTGIGGDSQNNTIKTEKPLQLTTLNNKSDTLTTLNNQTLKSPTVQNFEQKMDQQRQERQNEADQRQQLLNQRANQARNYYDNNLQTITDKVNSSKNITNDSYKDIAGQSATSIANSYKNNALRKLANDDMTLSNKSSDLINKYRSLSSDDRWDVYQNLQKAKNKLTQAITKADDEGRNDLKEAYASQLSEVNLFDEMLANEDKGEKSFGKSLGDWLSGGGFVGNLAEPVSNALGNISGNQETSRLISQDRAATKEGNNKLFDVVDFAGETTANIAANALTGGAYGLASSGMNLGDAIQVAVNDRNRQYYTDYEGNLTREDQSMGSKLAGIGNAALGLGMTAAGMKGFGPNIKFNNAGQTLQSAVANREWGDLAKTMGKYAAKEIPFAVGQTALQQGISAAGGDQQFGDNFGQQLASDIVGDLAVDLTGALRQGRGGSRDLFESGRQDNQSALQRLKNMGQRVAENGAMSIKDVSNEGLSDRFGNRFTEEDIPVSQLRRSQQFQPRTTASGKGTSDSVYKNGYDEGRVDQPMLVRKSADGTYEVLGGHSRTEGLERRAAEGLDNPDTVKARVYDGISDKQALQISQAANQGGQYESIIDMAKSISDARQAGIEPSVQRQNMVKGYNMDDYETLHKILAGDRNMQDRVFQGAISQEDMLSIARTARRIGFTPERTLNLVRMAYEDGKFNRKNIEATMKGLATKAQNQELSSKTNSMFNLDDFELKEAVDSMDDYRAQQKAERQQKMNDNSLTRVIKNIGGYSQEQTRNLLSALQELGRLPNNQRLATANGAPVYTGGVVSDTPALDKLARSAMSIEYENGRPIMRIDNDILKDVPDDMVPAEIRKSMRKFKGKSYKIGDTDETTVITKQSRGKTAGKDSSEQTIDDIRLKGNIGSQADEYIENLQNVRKEKVKNPEEKPQVSHYLAGDLEVRKGKNAYDTVGKVEVDKTGNSRFYGPYEIKEKPTGEQSSANLVGQTRMQQTSQGHNKMIAQIGRKVNGQSALATIFGLKRKIGDNSVQQYVKDQVALQQKQSKPSLREKSQSTWDNLKHYLVDDAVAYQRYVKDKGERQIIDNGVDRVRASDTIAKQMIEDSGLAETIGKMKTEDADEFQQYLIAKRGQELKRQKGADFKTGRDDAADIALIKSVGNKYAAQEKVVRDFNKMMLDYSVETGLISKNLRDQLVRDNTDYVPMNRIMDDIEGMGMHKSKQLANLSKQTAVQKIKGSDRIVQNPLESMIKNAVRVVNEGERNKTAKYLADTAAFREARMPEGAKARPGYDTLSFLQDGKQVKYEVPELVAKEMKNLNNVMGDNAQQIVNILSTPARLLRAGATGDNPMFAASNLIRDQLQTVVTGSIPANFRGTPKAFVAAFVPGQKGKALRAELARAGVTGTEYRQTYGYKPGELVKELQAGHQMPKQAWERLKHPIDTIADVIGRTEYFTRAQQYFGTKGTPEQKALAARNNTLNFSRGGSAVRVLNKMIPFLNAGVQGGRITVRQFKERPIRTTGAIAATIGVAAAARAINNSMNQDLYDRLGDEEKKNNLVFFTEDSKYDPETNRVTGVVKIPMPQMLYPVLDAVNNIEGKPEDLLTMAGDIFTAISGIESPDTQANSVGESFLPVVNQLTPTAIKPFLETAMNKNTYTGQEIVSEYDKNKNPEDKGAKYTTDAARKLAQITGVDAPVIDNFINNWGGGVTKDLVKVLGDNPDNKKDGGGIGKIFDEGAFRRFASGSIESQYEIAEGIAKNYKNEVKNNDAFKNLSANDQEKVLNAIDTDMNKIAGISAKVEQNRGDEIGDNGLSKRQTEIMNNGFNASSYIGAVLDKKQLYQGNGDSGNNGGDFSTLNGNALDYGKANTARNNPVEVNYSLDQADKDTLNQYNSMSSEDWEKYEYSMEGRDAEYKLAKAQFENDKANGNLSEVQIVKKQKELRKLEVGQLWNKDIRDAYGLAGNKSDMQELLNSLDNRDDMVGYLNAINRAMYEAGVITASTYKTRNRNINNLSNSSSSGGGSSKKSSAYSSSARSALSALSKALSSGNNIKVNKTPSAPSTSRKMANTSLKSTSLKKYSVGNPTITVKKGIK